MAAGLHTEKGCTEAAAAARLDCIQAASKAAEGTAGLAVAAAGSAAVAADLSPAQTESTRLSRLSRPATATTAAVVACQRERHSPLHSTHSWTWLTAKRSDELTTSSRAD